MIAGRRPILGLAACIVFPCCGDGGRLPAWSAEGALPQILLSTLYPTPRDPSADVTLRLRHTAGESHRLAVRVEQELLQAADSSPELRVRTATTLEVEESVASVENEIALVRTRVLAASVQAEGVAEPERREIERTAVGRASEHREDARGLVAAPRDEAGGSAKSEGAAVSRLLLRLPEGPARRGQSWAAPATTQGEWTVSAEFRFEGMSSVKGRECAVVSVALSLQGQRSIEASAGGARIATRGVGRGLVFIDLDAGAVAASEVATSVVQDGEVYSAEGPLRSRVLETTRVQTLPSGGGG